MLLWVFLSLLPLVDGAHMTAGGAAAGSEAGDAAGLLRGQEELELPLTLPEAAVDEEQEDGGHPYSTWHALYGTQPLRSRRSQQPHASAGRGLEGPKESAQSSASIFH